MYRLLKVLYRCWWEIRYCDWELNLILLLYAVVGVFSYLNNNIMYISLLHLGFLIGYSTVFKGRR